MEPATETISFDESGIERAADLIARGQVVAIASETVYGLAGDATNGHAIARIYEAKRRPAFNPLIIHVNAMSDALAIADFSPAALRLAAKFWPGPLTLVLPQRKDSPVAKLATAGLETVALRVPSHPAMRSLISASNKPLAAPSANASGHISPTLAAHVLASLGGRIPLIIDAGPTMHGIESTVVAVGAETILVLRPGPIDPQLLEITAEIPFGTTNRSNAIESPGQMSSHYAPAKPLRLNVMDTNDKEWLIGFGDVDGQDNLSASGDLVEAAAALFRALHRAEAEEPARIAVAPIPAFGLGLAINDRLSRAAAPRN